MTSSRASPPQWISVEDRYPDVDQDVIYFFEVCGTYVGKYFGEHCFAGEAGFLTDDVTHWMPYKKPKRTDVEAPAPIQLPDVILQPALARIAHLIHSDPAYDSPEGRELSLLAQLAELYEKQKYPEFAAKADETNV